jgi:hypothetical protein
MLGASGLNSLVDVLTNGTGAADIVLGQPPYIHTYIYIDTYMNLVVKSVIITIVRGYAIVFLTL